MKVILLVCFLTVASNSFGEEMKRVLSEENNNEDNTILEEKKTEEGSLQEKEQFKKDRDLRKLNNNNSLTVILDSGFEVQEGTKLGIIVVPDWPEKALDLQYQSQNTFEMKENGTTSDRSINVNENNTFTNDKVLTSLENSEEETTKIPLVNFEPNEEEKGNTASLVNNQLQDNLETTTELPTTVNPERKPSTTVKETLEVGHQSVTPKSFTSRNTFPTLNLEVIKRVDLEDHNSKVKRFSDHEPSLKKFESRIFNTWNLLDSKEKKHGSIVKITKEVPYPVPYPVEKKVPIPVKVEVARPIPIEVPKPYPVTFEKKVFFPIREYIHAPYPVLRKIPYFIPIAVDRPVPVHITRPYPVYIEKKVPYPVEKQIAIPINIPVERPTPVHFPIIKNIYYPVEKNVRYPVPVSVERPIAVPVEKPYPIYIEKKVPAPMEEQFPYPIHVENQPYRGDISQNYNFQKGDVAVESFPDHKIEYIGNQESPGFGVGDSDTASLSLSTNSYDNTSFQKKRDSEPQESQKEGTSESTTQPSLPEATTREERNTSNTDHDFVRK